MTDEWLRKLKAAFDAGYYRTEADEGGQESFPWEGRVCQDCPFSMGDVCQVSLERCEPHGVPCAFSDPEGQAMGKALIEDRLQMAWRSYWKWQRRP
jgi:hypothetical protein